MLNPSFEDTASMGNGYPFLITENWWSPNGFDADYFTPFCEELGSGSGALHCAGEVDYLGYQVAQDSSSYLGMVVYESTGDTKDYGQGFLSSILQEGETYCVGIWIALADSSSFLSCDFQVAFTNEQIQNGQAANLFLEDYVAFDISGINDSTWTYFEGTYTANGGEQYIYLGSNTPNEDLSCIEGLTPTIIWNACYILVDNVSVKESKLCNVSLENSIDNTLPGIFPNPVGDYFSIAGIGTSSVVKLFDSKGKLCFIWEPTNTDEKLNVSRFEQGIYFLLIEQASTQLRLKMLKE